MCTVLLLPGGEGETQLQLKNISYIKIVLKLLRSEYKLDLTVLF